MYVSSKSVSKNNLSKLRSDLNRFLKTTKSVYCKAHKKRIYLDKLPEALTERKNRKSRLKVFDIAIDILKHEPVLKESIKNGFVCYEIKGLDADNKEIIIHIREEKGPKKDRKLYFVSCFLRS